MLSIMAVLILSGLTGDPVWTWHTFPDHGFKIYSPVPLAGESRTLTEPGYSIDYHQFHGGSIGDSVLSLAFVIDHYRMPPVDEDGPGEARADFLKAAVDELLLAVGGSLIYYESGAHTVWEEAIWKASYREGQGVIRGRAILADDQFYGLQVFGVANLRPEEDMSRFLNSFAVLPRSSGE